MHIVEYVCTPDPYKTYLHLTYFFDAFRKQSLMLNHPLFVIATPSVRTK